MDRPSRDAEGPGPQIRAQPGSGPPAKVITEEPAASRPAPLQILGDAPAEKDELGRGSYVEALARVITSADTPLVVAIYGAWGTGKTSLMKQLQHRLAQPGAVGRVARTVWFDPWMHQSDEIPALGLLHETAKELDQEVKQRVKDALINVGRAMVSELRVPVVGLRVGRVWEEVAAGVYEQRTQQARLRHYFEVVLDAAGRKHGRLVFFIDDLDRCRPRTALRLLEALQLFFNFENCIFVLGLDREPVEAAIAAEYGDLGVQAESFLDKIIQLPFTLPPIPESVIDSFVTSRVPDQLKACHPILSAAAPDDPRQLKRTINVLVLSHYLVDPTSFEQAYDPRILAAVVLIENLAPALYRVLRMRPAAIHELQPAGSQDSSQASTGSVTQIEPSELWVKYVAPVPGLARALHLVPIAADLDIGPYLKLTSAVAMSAEVDSSHRSRLTVWSALSADADDLDGIIAQHIDNSISVAV
jgi:KAP-like P-loop domain-containing protein